MNRPLDGTARALKFITKRWRIKLWKKRYGISKKEEIPHHKWQILKGDIVECVTGRHRGKQGKVLKVYRDRAKIIVDGVNVKIYPAPVRAGEPPKLKRLAMPLWARYFQLICPITQQPTIIRYRHRTNEDGTRERIRVTEHGAVLEKPVESQITRTIHPLNPKYDTAQESAKQRTWVGPWEFFTEEQRECILADASERGIDSDKIPELISKKDPSILGYLELLPQLPHYFFQEAEAEA